jgi:poly(3-hydroxybutyrate) depolymerase
MWVVLVAAALAQAQPLPTAQIIDEVRCMSEPSQSYALYLPSNFKPDRAWPVIFAFDPGARGRTAVERFSKAAEKYGYIVAGSRNSRNGSMDASMTAAQAMWIDVDQRFRLDPKRVYTAGMSGGARVAMQVALSTKQVAGVIAASAGFPDSQPRKTVPFLVFGTAGSEDFNHLEMRELDHTLKSPHRVAIFPGGHVWLSQDLAQEAVEWMEVQGIQSGVRPRDTGLIAALLQTRESRLAALTEPKERYLAIKGLLADFSGLTELNSYAAQAAVLEKQKAVKDGLRQDLAEDSRERQTIGEVNELEHELRNPSGRTLASSQLRDKLTRLAKQSSSDQDTAERRIARRVLRGFLSGGMERGRDAEYRKMIEDLRARYPDIGARR